MYISNSRGSLVKNALNLLVFNVVLDNQLPIAIGLEPQVTTFMGVDAGLFEVRFLPVT